jgi:hypothetical protein
MGPREIRRRYRRRYNPFLESLKQTLLHFSTQHQTRSWIQAPCIQLQWIALRSCLGADFWKRHRPPALALSRRRATYRLAPSVRQPTNIPAEMPPCFPPCVRRTSVAQKMLELLSAPPSPDETAYLATRGLTKRCPPCTGHWLSVPLFPVRGSELTCPTSSQSENPPISVWLAPESQDMLLLGRL